MCRVVVIAAVSGCLCFSAVKAEAQDLDRRLFANEAVYQLHLANPAYRSCDGNLDGALQPDELLCYDALPIKASDLPPPPVRTGTPIIDASVEAAAARTAVVAGARQEAAPDPLAASNKAFLLVRRSRSAIGSSPSRSDRPQAPSSPGPTITSPTTRSGRRAASSRRPSSITGKVLRDDPYIDTLTLAPYVNFDRVSNSTRITSDVDNLTYGGVFEAGFANVFGATQFLDISGEVVTSFAGESKNWSIDLEWQPVGGRNPEGGNTIFAYLGAPQPFGRYFVITASPSLQAEYVAELGEVSTQPIFAEHNEAFRAGPAVRFAIDGVKIDPVPWWIQRLHYEISYGWLYDFLSGRDYELLDTSLTFALDPKGHLGLTFSYRNGQLVETGQDVDLANIALSVSY